MMDIWWKLRARLGGWREAYDDDIGVLVVWHPTKCIHFTGPEAWKFAAQYKGE